MFRKFWSSIFHKSIMIKMSSKDRNKDGENENNEKDTFSRFMKLIFVIILLACAVILLFSSQYIYSNRKDLPEPIESKGFGITCPPGVCVFSEGFYLNQRDSPFAVHFVDHKRGWIVGHHGLVLMTPDGGNSLQRISATESNESLKDVFFIGENGWIVGDYGLILHTSDGGKSWDKQTTNVTGHLLSVYFIDSKKGFTVGTDGIALETQDGGSSWNLVDIDWMNILSDDLMAKGIISIDLFDVFYADETFGWIVGDSGTILRTLDGGKEWSVSQIGVLPPLFSVCFKNERDGWAVGHRGTLIKTSDGGESWQKFPLKTQESLYSIRLAGKYGAIVGNIATMFKTTDGGDTWVELPHNLSPPYPWLADSWILWSSKSVKALIVGKSIIIEKQVNSIN